MPDQIARAKESIGSISKQRDRAKEKFAELLKYFRASAFKSSDFCLLWDNFFVPEALLVKRPEKLKKGYLGPSFCGQGKRITSEHLAVLWGCKTADLHAAAAAAKAKARGKGRQSKVVPGARRPVIQRRKSLNPERRQSRQLLFTEQVEAVMTANRLSRLSSAGKSALASGEDSDSSSSSDSEADKKSGDAKDTEGE